ncbi:unannotated protein [freshwater metagenome]|uniref:Unannotated protein n=1 Tax=freshwater metagenome TaxID=449393 RepID=A0A6J7AKB5_9ZZZZ
MSQVGTNQHRKRSTDKEDDYRCDEILNSYDFMVCCVTEVALDALIFTCQEHVLVMVEILTHRPTKWPNKCADAGHKTYKPSNQAQEHNLVFAVKEECSLCILWHEFEGELPHHDSTDCAESKCGNNIQSFNKTFLACRMAGC